MKTKYIIILSLVLVFLHGSCTKDNFVKSGVSVGRFDGSLLEYLDHPGHSYDWDSVVVMIHHAGPEMVNLFEGSDPAHPEMTFLGLTNHTIRRYLLDNGLKEVADLDAAYCKKLLLSHLIDGKLYRDSVPAGKTGDGTELVQGGMECTTLWGNKLLFYTFKGSYNGVDGLGANTLHLVSPDTMEELKIQTTDIEPDNSIVHAMGYFYHWNDMFAFDE